MCCRRRRGHKIVAIRVVLKGATEKGVDKVQMSCLKRLYFDYSASLNNVTCWGLRRLVCEHSGSRITETEGIKTIENRLM